MAEREFAVTSDREAAAEAMLLKDACLATHSYDWLIALSLILDDSATLASKFCQYSASYLKAARFPASARIYAN